MPLTEELLAGFAALPSFGKRARDRARARFGRTVRIVHRGAAGRALPALGRGDATFAAPERADLQRGDTWIEPVEPTPTGRQAFVERLVALRTELADLDEVAFAPVPTSPAGPCALWAVAAARLALPESVRIAARFDVLGTHVAQIALSFGADTLEGPITAERSLPLAGVFRPTETSRPALEALVRSAGAEPMERTP